MMKNKAIRICVYGFVSLLFNNAALAQSHENGGAVDGVEEISKSKERMIQRVVKKSFDNFILPEGGIVIGDDLPETFWNLSLTVTNHSSRLLSLKHRKREFMIIEFWSSGCPSCITMIDSLHRLQAQFGDLITVLPINIFDRPEKAKATIEERGWTLPVAITYGDSILNRLFLTRYDFRQIWIKDGKLIAIPTKEMVNERVISDILTNRPVHIEMKDRFTYFDRRLSNGKGRKDEDHE